MSVRTAVLGAGSMGKHHIRCLTQIPEAEVVAVMDPHAPSGRAAAAEFGVPTAYTDLGSLLDTEAPDYVVVASPARYHARQSIAAFEAGAHVLCEKPLCMDMTEAETIVDTAQRTGRLFTMGFQIRQRRALRALRDFIAAGHLGQVYHSRVWGSHTMNYPWGRFHHRQDQSLGGVMAGTVVHYLDALIWVLGVPKPTTISASTFRRLDKMPSPPINFNGTVDEVTVEDFGHAHVRFADGSTMSIEGNWLMHPCARGAGFEINGVLGVAKDCSPMVELEERDKIVPVELESAPEPEDATAEEHREFIAAINGRGQGQATPIVTFEEALTVQRILVGVYDSAARGEEVRL